MTAVNPVNPRPAGPNPVDPPAPHPNPVAGSALGISPVPASVPITPATPLSPEQKVAQKKAEDEKRAADEKLKVLSEANTEFHNDIAAAVAKRKKATEKYVTADLVGITEAAWNATRPLTDPEYRDSILPHQQKLQTHADSVIRTGLGEKPSEFEKKVADLLTKPEYKNLQAQTSESWGDSDVREGVAEDYKGDEGEKGVLAKNTDAKAKSDADAKANVKK